MADPVSLGFAISQSIVMAAHIGRAAKDFLNDAKNAPDEMDLISIEITDVQLVLQRLQPIISGNTEDIAAAPDVALDGLADLATIITGTAINISQLSQKMAGLQADSSSSLLSRTKWAYHKDHVLELVGRLQRNKSSLQLILAVLLCETKTLLIPLVSALHNDVQATLEGNRELKQRMERLESCVMQALRSQATSFIQGSGQSTLTTDDASTIRANTPRESAATMPTLQDTDTLSPTDTTNICTVHTDSPLSGPMAQFEESWVSGRPFDEILANSWVYQRVANRTASIYEAGTLIQSWSMLSGLSLTAISCLSVLALPLDLEDFNVIVPLEVALYRSHAESENVEEQFTDGLGLDPIELLPLAMEKLHDSMAKVEWQTRRLTLNLGGPINTFEDMMGLAIEITVLRDDALALEQKCRACIDRLDNSIVNLPIARRLTSLCRTFLARGSEASEHIDWMSERIVNTKSRHPKDVLNALTDCRSYLRQAMSALKNMTGHWEVDSSRRSSSTDKELPFIEGWDGDTRIEADLTEKTPDWLDLLEFPACRVYHAVNEIQTKWTTVVKRTPEGVYDIFASLEKDAKAFLQSTLHRTLNSILRSDDIARYDEICNNIDNIVSICQSLRGSFKDDIGDPDVKRRNDCLDDSRHRTAYWNLKYAENHLAEGHRNLVLAQEI